MEAQKKIEVRNYAAFLPVENGERKYKIIVAEDGSEKGIEVKGFVTSFADGNENGMRFDRKSYDKCIVEYFEKNEINIPIDLMHIRDMFHLAGVCKKFQKKQDGVEITVFIPKGVYFYGLIKTLIDNGVLQGFSNYGWITNWTEKDGVLVVLDFRLVSISLVDVPADVAGKFQILNTVFEGFQIDGESEKTENKKSLSIYGL